MQTMKVLVNAGDIAKERLLTAQVRALNLMIADLYKNGKTRNVPVRAY